MLQLECFMEIITDLSSFRKAEYPNLVVALGNFDGLHLGHMEILRLIRDRAKQINGTSAVFTFKEHPQRVLGGKDAPPILTSLVHKLFLLEQTGIDLCFLVDFTIPLSKTKAEDFVSERLIEQLGAREICLGFNARFGQGRQGDSPLMRQLSRIHSFAFIEAPSFAIEGQVVSSSLIRSLVREGRLEEVPLFLGRPYSFFGTVVPGSGRGRQLGFPTANLDPHNEAMPPEGVYAAWVRIFDCEMVETKNHWYQLEKRLVGDHLKALLNYGKRPTFGRGEKALPEVHILGFHDHLIGKTVEVEVGRRIRSEQKFDDASKLKTQIFDDIKIATKWFEKEEKERKYGT